MHRYKYKIYAKCFSRYTKIVCDKLRAYLDSAQRIPAEKSNNICYNTKTVILIVNWNIFDK